MGARLQHFVPLHLRVVAGHDLGAKRLLGGVPGRGPSAAQARHRTAVARAPRRRGRAAPFPGIRDRRRACARACGSRAAKGRGHRPRSARCRRRRRQALQGRAATGRVRAADGGRACRLSPVPARLPRGAHCCRRAPPPLIPFLSRDNDSWPLSSDATRRKGGEHRAHKQPHRARRNDRGGRKPRDRRSVRRRSDLPAVTGGRGGGLRLAPAAPCLVPSVRKSTFAKRRLPQRDKTAPQPATWT